MNVILFSSRDRADPDARRKFLNLASFLSRIGFRHRLRRPRNRQFPIRHATVLPASACAVGTVDGWVTDRKNEWQMNTRHGPAEFFG
ncbi:hypothetical protein [Novosphingobium sp. 9]|uniref:hypothetical protein n=1 Tax=Novosphingobium sp. 9 TaxID=2025349 RepID=UPI0021B67AE3|nr:hypothetical protein [Novosphingobium sp. 9]